MTNSEIVVTWWVKHYHESVMDISTFKKLACEHLTTKEYTELLNEIGEI